MQDVQKAKQGHLPVQELSGIIILEYCYAIFFEKLEPGHEVILPLWLRNVHFVEDLIDDRFQCQ